MIMHSRDLGHAQESAGRSGTRGGVHAFQTHLGFILVLDSNAELDNGHWRASARLDHCGPDTVQHDGSTFRVPRTLRDQVCRRVVAQHVNGERDNAFIVQLAR
jgi:hypothetical protein